MLFRMQLTQALNVIPDVQYWNRNDPGLDTADAWIFGIRLAYGF